MGVDEFDMIVADQLSQLSWDVAEVVLLLVVVMRGVLAQRAPQSHVTSTIHTVLLRSTRSLYCGTTRSRREVTEQQSGEWDGELAVDVPSPKQEVGRSVNSSHQRSTRHKRPT